MCYVKLTALSFVTVRDHVAVRWRGRARLLRLHCPERFAGHVLYGHLPVQKKRSAEWRERDGGRIGTPVMVGETRNNATSKTNQQTIKFRLLLWNLRNNHFTVPQYRSLLNHLNHPLQRTSAPGRHITRLPVCQLCQTTNIIRRCPLRRFLLSDISHPIGHAHQSPV
jgi:hypothetical protein